MKDFIRKQTAIRKKTSKKNAGLFSDLSYKAEWFNYVINKHLSHLLAVIGIFIVNK
jgi:hypothetical protein